MNYQIQTLNAISPAIYTQLGELVIKGKNLHIDTVSVETGDMRVSGDIWSLQYGDKDRKGALSALGKLFR